MVQIKNLPEYNDLPVRNKTVNLKLLKAAVEAKVVQAYRRFLS